MARTKSSSGLSLGQILMLTLGFLVTSMLIFLFGIWVGKNRAERQIGQSDLIVRKTVVETADGRVTQEPATPAVAPQEEATAPARPRPPTKSPTATFTETPTPVIIAVRPTNTAPGAIPSPPATPGLPTPSSIKEWADAGWTVQVYATTDPLQARALARRLLAKGYPAYTLEAPMRGLTWHRVRVGRFESRERAKMMERRLKQLEGMEAAYVTAQ